MLPVCCVFIESTASKLYTLSLHDALPIFLDVSRRLDLQVDGIHVVAAEHRSRHWVQRALAGHPVRARRAGTDTAELARSEEHTSELQSRLHLVCRLLLEKKK